MATITEDYVSFEIAKLLKEKGFDARCPMIYTADGELLYTDVKHHNMYAVTNKQLEYYTDIIAPSQSMAMKWLRKEHKIHIQIWILEEKGYWFNIEKIINTHYKHKSLYSTGLEDIYFESNEQACEAAIKYCLEHFNLINYGSN